MFGIGETELVIIVVFAFLLFGPDKLPGMGRTLGRVLRQFREASDGFTEVVQTNIMDPAAEELEKSPKQRKREAAAQAAAAQTGVGADAPEAEGAATSGQPPRRETFAERKARLQAERAAHEAAEAKAQDAEQSAPTQTAEAAGSQQVTPAAAPATTEPDATEPDATEPEQPVRKTAADLYALSGRRSSRAQVAQEAAGQTEASAQPDVPEAQSASAPKDGGEDGNASA